LIPSFTPIPLPPPLYADRFDNRNFSYFSVHFIHFSLLSPLFLAVGIDATMTVMEL
jgi:hypothetical protein